MQMFAARARVSKTLAPVQDEIRVAAQRVRLGYAPCSSHRNAAEICCGLLVVHHVLPEECEAADCQC